MHISAVLVSVLILFVSTEAQVLSRLNAAFRTPPEFSHRRDKQVPQNVDIIEVIETTRTPAPVTDAPVRETPIVTTVQPVRQGAPINEIQPVRQSIVVGAPVANQNAQFVRTDTVVQAGIAVQLPAADAQDLPGMSKDTAQDPNLVGVALPPTLGASGPSADGITNIRPGRPGVVSQPIGQISQASVVAPVQSMPNIRTNPVANDRLVNTIFESGNTGAAMTPVNTPAVRRNNCDFNIPSFLLPDMTISQREFEQMYLLPALRAHLTAQECRSRALTVYIDWLLYLRLRNFNV